MPNSNNDETVTAQKDRRAYQKPVLVKGPLLSKITALKSVSGAKAPV